MLCVCVCVSDEYQRLKENEKLCKTLKVSVRNSIFLCL